MKKFIKHLVFALILINLGLTIQMGVAQASPGDEGGTYYGPLGQIQKIGKGVRNKDDESILPNFISTGQHPDAPPDYLQPGVGAASSPIYFAIDMFRYVVSGIAILIILIQAVKLVSTANDEEAGNAKMTLLYGIVGLLVIQLADVGVKKMFFGEQGDAFENLSSAEVYAEESVAQVRGIIGFVEVFVGAAAMLSLVIRGMLVITSAGTEEAVTKAKNHIIYAIIGIAVIVVSEVVVRGVIFPENGEKLPDTEVAKTVIVGLTNYFSGFVAILAFMILFYGGYRYVMSAGNEEMNDKLKKTIIGAVIGLVLTMGAFAIVNTVIDFEPEDSEAVNESETAAPEELQ